MNIIRRTGGGRGVYELSGSSAESLTSTDLVGRELALQVAASLVRPTGIILTEQGGKPRLVLSQERGGCIQIQRQVASMLLLPKPIRADDAMGSGKDVLKTDKYALQSISLASVIPIGDDVFQALPDVITAKNTSGECSIPFLRRFSRVTALWSQRDKFPADIAHCLKCHEAAVLRDGPVDDEAEQIVVDLQSAIAQHAVCLGADCEADMDPLAILDRVSFNLPVTLCAKPFVILTGPSGTGKSKEAIEIAAAFDYGSALPDTLKQSRRRPASCMAFVPVGAGWTDQKDLLGYRTPFGPKRNTANGETHDTYIITDALRLILRASHRNYNMIPHFLILDEMNLSHVERYLSSFLSLMEADRSSRGGRFELICHADLRLIRDVLQYEGNCPMEAEAADDLVTAGVGLPFPPNLYIVGTVNVDETTYMFSPKVLDRAFVMELMSVDPTDFMEPKSVGMMPSASGSRLLGSAAVDLFESSIRRRMQQEWEKADPLSIIRLAASNAALTEKAEEIGQGILRVLHGCYKLLEPVGFGFGYRVVNEVCQYMAAWIHAGSLTSQEENFTWDWPKALDAAVLMKVLPKIHGNRRQLGDSLKALSHFLGGEQDASYQIGSNPPIQITADEMLAFVLAESRKKTERMYWELQASGYATYI